MYSITIRLVIALAVAAQIVVLSWSPKRVMVAARLLSAVPPLLQSLPAG